jgi:integrase/recombinase XerD
MPKRTPGSPPPKTIPVNCWPEADRTAWLAAHRPGDVLDPGGVASTWSLATQRKTASGDGRYLFWLAERGELNPAAAPADRVTRERLASYLTDLRRDNRGHTIQNRIQELGDALRALAPEGDWRWILKAAARLRASTIPAYDKRSCLRSISELVVLGFQLMHEAENDGNLSELGRAALHRDGLILALLAAHPLRLRNFASLRIGYHLVEAGELILLKIPAAESKAHQPYEATLTPELALAMRRYLHQHRPVLLVARGRWHASAGDALWISKDGSPCSRVTFANVIRRHTGSPSGRPLTPHLFRSCAATTIAAEAPQSVEIIPAVLGHGSRATGERYYNLAGSLEATRVHSAVLAEIRRSVRPKTGTVRRRRDERGSDDQSLFDR